MRGPSGRGRRNRRRRRRRRRRTQKWNAGTVTSSDVGRAVRARAESGPAWKGGNVRHTGDESKRCISRVRSSQSVRCFLRKSLAGSSPQGPGCLCPQPARRLLHCASGQPLVSDAKGSALNDWSVCDSSRVLRSLPNKRSQGILLRRGMSHL